MNDRDNQKNLLQLREQADALLARREQSAAMNDRRSDKLLHELQVHQIELEMQNEALRQSQLELEKSRDRYMDFYDFSPVAYITLSALGLITEINLTGAAMLGVDRAKLRQQRFAAFIADDYRDQWYRHFMAAISHDETVTCELALHNRDGARSFAQLVCLRLNKNDGPPVLRIVLTDITERIRKEEDQQAQRELCRTHVSRPGQFQAAQ